ncbi:MAG: ABC transporter ATP-binding protein [Acidimicrobiia bacterium]
MPAEPFVADAVPGSSKPDPVLVVDGLVRRFGGLVAVDVDHLEVQTGTITSLIGPNGAGKTTLFNLLTGFDKPDAGAWHLEGGPLVGIASYEVARRGMVRTFQLTKSLARLTVLDNVVLGAGDQTGERFGRALVGGWRSTERRNEARALELLDWFGLADKRDDYAGSLSGGQRKLLEMARALMFNPSVIMLDEPMAGVNPALTEQLLHHITALRDEQFKTVVFIEHDMDVVMEISDWVVVLAQGSVISEGPPSHVMADRAVIDAYLGSTHGEHA